jgi:hypothetical protein
MDDANDQEVIDLEDPIIDATNLIIDEIEIDDDGDYDELIILDLRNADRHDAWLY